MRQCLKISFRTSASKMPLEELVRKSAQQFGIEGTVQADANDSIVIIACSSKDSLEQFLDVLHQDLVDNEVAIEPFLKTKDYRGVFRVIA